MSSWTVPTEPAPEVAEQDYSPVWQGEDGCWNYRVSAVYGCTSLLLAYRLGMSGSNSTPAWLQERFNEGHAYELPILERARQRGFSDLYNFQDRTVQQIGKGARLLGHIDALGLGHGDLAADTIDGKKLASGEMMRFDYQGPILIDAKAFAQSTWDNWNRSGFAAFPYYGWSMSAYAKNYGDIPIAMAIGLKDREVYEATGETVLKDFRLDIFTKPPVPFGRIMAKILKVEKLAAKGMDGLPEACDVPTFPCFAAGTLVLTYDGYLPIEEVQVGDKVLSHTGQWRSVMKLHETPDVPLRELKAHGSTVVTTDDHPVWARRRSRHKVASQPVRSFTAATWVPVKDLGQHDFVAQVLPPEETTEHPDDMLWLAGRWVADGWQRTPRGSGVIICAGDEVEEKEIRIRLDAIGLHATSAPERTSIKLHITSGWVGDFMAQFGEYAHGKKLPGWVLGLPPVQARAFLDGYLTGDGHDRKLQTGWVTSTVSKELAYGLAVLIQRGYGVVASVWMADRGEQCVIEGRTVAIRKTWIVQFPEENNIAFVEGAYGWKPIRSSTPLEERATVYNIEVEEDSSYVVQGLIVHNCPFFSLPFHTKAGKGLEIKDGEIVGGLEKLAELANAKHAAQQAGKRAQQVGEEIDAQIRELVGDVESHGNLAAHSDVLSSISLYHSGYPKVRWDEMTKDFPGLLPEKYKETAKSEKLTVKVNPKRESPKPNTSAIID